MSRPTEVLIVNQHGNNRGDEAALRAMLRALGERLGDVRFALLHQFRERRLPITFEQPVEDLALILPPLEAAGLALWAVARALRLPLPFLLSRRTRAIVAAYARADLVVSAPGGPYFGDLYWGHELVHWFYVALARLHGKPLFLYAPSAGPFRIAWLNPIRRALYRSFDALAAREEISATHIRNLLADGTEVTVTADAALQSSIEPAPRSEYFTGPRAALADRFLVAVSLLDHRFAGEPDPERLRARYERVMLDAMLHLAGRRDAHFLLFPQLYGPEPTDHGFLERMAARMPGEISLEIVDPGAGSDAQQALFAMSDLHLASRYHPAIFGHAGGVPGLCVYYEHKALGFMQQLGLERYAFDIRKLEGDAVRAALDELLDRRDEIREILRRVVPELRARARLTSDLAVAVLRAAEERS